MSSLSYFPHDPRLSVLADRLLSLASPSPPPKASDICDRFIALSSLGPSPTKRKLELNDDDDAFEGRATSQICTGMVVQNAQESSIITENSVPGPLPPSPIILHASETRELTAMGKAVALNMIFNVTQGWKDYATALEANVAAVTKYMEDFKPS